MGDGALRLSPPASVFFWRECGELESVSEELSFFLGVWLLGGVYGVCDGLES